MFANMCCHDIAVVFSLLASVAGLLILSQYKPFDDERRETERILLQMSFSYWLIYCLAFGAQKIINTDIESIISTLKITTALSYLLTFSCILSLPLHKFAIRQVEN